MDFTRTLLEVCLALVKIVPGGKMVHDMISLPQQNLSLPISAPFYPSPWMTPNTVGWEHAYAQAKDFVSQLTLLEKINLTTGVGWEGEQCVGQTGSIPRLGFRSLCMQDGPVGVRSTDLNSVFPSGQTIAASFDRGLFYERGFAMGEEHKQKGVTVLLGPVAGPLGRAPEGGRNWEGFSPDPYLTGIAMAESIKGIQDAGVIACAKHFIGNEQEHFRQKGEGGFDIEESISSNIDDTTMHELYLWPFADAVRAGVGSVMCSYNQVNNSYACQNSKVLNNLLKDELGFQGFVMSDWQAQHTGVASAVAGLDMTMPGDTIFNSGESYWGANLTLGVINGTIPEWRIDDMAMRIMAAYFKVGLTLREQPINFNSWTLETNGPLHASSGGRIQQVNWHVDVRGNHSSLIRRLAARSTVLLKNVENALPLSKPKLITVIGEDAGPASNGPNGCPDRGCNHGTLGTGWGSGTANFPYLVTPDVALHRQALEDNSGYKSVLSNYALNQIKKLVSRPDTTAIVFVNSNSGEGFINVDGNQGDRNNLTLWNGGDNLIKTVAANCNNTIVVIHSTGPTIVSGWHGHPNVTAILWAGLPGQESGHSITDVLYGRVNPAARTPFTWAADREDYGTDILYKLNNNKGSPQDNFTEGVFIDYRAFDAKEIKPLYEFGFGLSYTTFKYSDLIVTPSDGYNQDILKSSHTTTAPTFGNISKELHEYTFPENFPRVPQYIYPYINGEDPKEASEDPHYGKIADEFLPPHATDGSPQPVLQAGGAPGGNAKLWDVIYTVKTTIKNTGKLNGEEVPQLYLSLGGPADPKLVLRGFQRLSIDAGQSVVFTADILRRDLSNWDPVKQDWVITNHTKMVYVGPSSRNLPLSQVLYRTIPTD